MTGFELYMVSRTDGYQRNSGRSDLYKYKRETGQLSLDLIMYKYTSSDGSVLTFLKLWNSDCKVIIANVAVKIAVVFSLQGLNAK